MKNRFFKCIVACALMLVMVASVALAETVYVSQDGGSLKVRSGPGTNYEVAGYVQHGESVNVLDRGDSWSQIKVVRTGKVGYIKTRYLSNGSSGGSTGGSGTPSTGTASTYEPATIMTKTLGGAVNLRSGAGTGYSSLGTLSRGNFLKVIGREGDWVKVNTTNAKTGYVHKNYVSFGVKGTTTGNVNFRKGPGTSYGVIRTLSTGTTVTVTSVEGKWAKVSANGTTGYISTSYFKF